MPLIVMRSKGADDHKKGADNRKKRAENRSKGADNRKKGTDSRSKGANNHKKGTDSRIMVRIITSKVRIIAVRVQIITSKVRIVAKRVMTIKIKVRIIAVRAPVVVDPSNKVDERRERAERAVWRFERLANHRLGDHPPCRLRALVAPLAHLRTHAHASTLTRTHTRPPLNPTGSETGRCRRLRAYRRRTAPA